VTLNVAPAQGRDTDTETSVGQGDVELVAVEGRSVKGRRARAKPTTKASIEEFGSEAPMSARELTAPEGAVGDSMTVAMWTTLSRVSGFVRVATVAAVLGPTFFGNTYQFTNSLPNLVYYGFLAGSLFSSLLVPALVRHIDRDDRVSAERVASGLFGVVGAGMLVVLPLAVLVTPELLRLASVGSTPGSHAGELGIGRLLVAMLMPQILFYGVIGTATAVQNAYRKFALPAAAPVMENLGTIGVLLAVRFLFPPVRNFAHIPLAELLLLGLGSTAAVGIHAAVQWWGRTAGRGDAATSGRMAELRGAVGLAPRRSFTGSGWCVCRPADRAPGAGRPGGGRRGGLPDLSQLLLPAGGHRRHTGGPVAHPTLGPD